MTTPFRELTLDELDLLLQAYVQIPNTRQITGVHLHHTWVPDHTSWRGLRTLEAIRRDHMQVRGFSDIAQHLTIDPQGRLWSGRPFYRAPASSLSPPGQNPPFNGTQSMGPIMIEMVGNFDTGHDALQGAQLQAVVGAIARILKHAGLGVKANTLVPHCAMDPGGKTCAGTSVVAVTGQFVPGGLRPVNWTTDIPAHVTAAMPTLVAAVQRSEIHFDRVKSDPLIAREVTRGSVEEERDFRYEVPERKYALTDLVALEAQVAARRAGGLCDEATDDELRQHVINLAYGQLSSEGGFTSDPAQLRQVFDALEAFLALRPDGERRVVFPVHGGLVGEADGIAYARQHIRWWKANGIYPIFFVWESGFFDVFKQRYLGARGLADISDKLIEVLTGPLGRRAWAEMKRSCRLAFQPRLDDGEVGGGYRALQLLRDLLRRRDAEVHLIGHSAGSIFTAELISRWFSDPELAVEKKENSIKSLQYLAPAITRQAFKTQVLPHLGQNIKQFRVYTMDDDRERDDDCKEVYRKSLLYLVSRAFEDAGEHVPILGMERYLTGHQSDPNLSAALTGLGNASVIHYSSDANDEKGFTRARHHGDFDNEPFTMESVLRVIAGIGHDRYVFVRYCDMLGCGDLCRPAAERGGARGADLAAIDDRSCDCATIASVGGTRGARATSSPRKRALVIGIDRYVGVPGFVPLQGCVADAREWTSVFGQLGFETQVLLDQQATITAMHGWLREAIEGARPGDILALSFSGHGTRDPRSNAVGEADRRDDYLVMSPTYGKYLYADDQLRELLQALPSEASFYAFLDSCHSGTMLSLAGRGAVRHLDLPVSAFETAAMRPTARVTRAADAGPAVLIAACDENESAHEIGARGVFSRVAAPALLTAVREKATCLAYANTCASRVSGQRPQLSYYNAADADRVILSPATRSGVAALRARG